MQLLRLRLVVRILVLVAVVGVVLLVGRTRASEAEGAGTPAAAAPAAPSLDDELVEQRTATSRTFRQDDGAMVTRLFAQPVNFRNAQDDWQHIDPTLVAADQAGYVHQRANDGDVLIPTAGLTRPVRVERDGTWVSLRLRGGEDASAAVVQGDTARFDDAAQSTDATYQATNTGVKETLTLADASAPSQFAYDLDASSGLTPHAVDDGGIELRDATGQPLFRLTAPVVWDAASGPSDPEPASVSVQPSGSGWVLRLAIDEAWLSDPARAFPVTVDPTVQWLVGGTMRYSGAQRDCTVASGDLATTSLCTEPTVRVGSDGSHTYKSLLFFDTPRAIWQDAEIEDATLLLHVGGTGTAPTSNLRVRAITDSWTNDATWNSRDGSAAWATPGGDVSQAAADVGPAAPIAGLNAWYRWPVPAEVVQRWTWGTQSDFGVQLSADSGSPEAVYAFESTENDPYKWPAIDIYWTPYKGDKPSYTQDVQRTSDHSQIAVNVANGSVKYTTQDLTLPGPAGDIPITMDRQWLSNQSYTVKAFGYGWSHPYEESTLRINADGSAFYVDTTGAPHRFASNGSGGFTAPADLDATLCKIQDTGTACTRDGVSGVSYKLTYPGAGLSYYFWSGGRLGTLRDTAGHAVRADWTSTHNTFTGSDNRAVTLNIDSSGWYSPSMVEGTRTWLFSRDAKDNLLTATLPTGGVATYEYNSDRLLTKITEPDGNQTRFEWGKLSRGSIVVTKIIHVLDPTDPTNPTKNPTTTYSYDFPNHKTIVTDAAGNATATPTDDGQTTYTYDENLRVISATPGSSSLPEAPQWNNADALWDTTRPIATPSGSWYDKQDGYVNGQGQQTVTLAASDAGGGVRRVALEDVGGSELASSRMDCTGTSDPPAACPATVSRTLTFDTSALPEGEHVFRQVTEDLAGNAGMSGEWTVTVDRTPPGPASGFDATVDPEDNSVNVSWTPVRDPLEADGSPGSGVGYVYRYERGAAAWSDWISTDDAGFTLPDGIPGQSFSVEVYAIDEAGNIGPLASGSDVADYEDLGSDNLGSEEGYTGDTSLDSEPTAPTDGTAASPNGLVAATDTYSETLCPDANPCGSYDRAAAARYALRWDLAGHGDTFVSQHHNHHYDYFGGQGGDCTNFASQVLKAGTMRFMRAQGRDSPDAYAGDGSISDYLKGEGSWWSYFVKTTYGSTGFVSYQYDKTSSWSFSNALYEHLNDYSLATDVLGPSMHPRKGDMVFYNLHGLDPSGFDHTQVVSRVTRHGVWVSQHSPAYYATLASVIHRNDTSDHRLGVDWTYRVVRPTYTAANIG